MSTCLFTGVQLSKLAKPEHAILNSLGGRIVSRDLTSDDFNAKAGAKIDFLLAEQFKLLVRELAPLLSSSLRKTRQKLVSEDGQRLYYKKGGRVDLASPYIERDPATNKINCLVSASTRGELNELALKGKWDLSKAVEVKVPFPDDILYTNKNPVLSVEGHISTLKCFLCAFDAMLCKNGVNEADRFTRHQKLAPLRELINRTVMSKEEPTVQELNYFFLGIQPDGEKVVKKVLEEYKLNPPPYAHVLIVSTNSAQKTIDGLWSFFGVEVHALRLAHNWDGAAFSKVIINPILGNNASPVIFNGDELNSLGHISKYKAFYWAKNKEQQPENDVIPYVSQIRKIEYREAMIFIELNANQFVKEIFMTILENISPGSTITDMACIRLLDLFKSTCPDSELKELISKEKFPSLARWDNFPASEFSSIDVSRFLSDYREAFKSLISPFRLPGHIVVRNVTIETSCDADKNAL